MAENSMKKFFRIKRRESIKGRESTALILYKSQIANSEEEFNEPTFKEYDPTPYGGGYNITTTYGQPLPPSTQTCYPPSLPLPTSQSSSPLPLVESPYLNRGQEQKPGSDLAALPPLPPNKKEEQEEEEVVEEEKAGYGANDNWGNGSLNYEDTCGYDYNSWLEKGIYDEHDYWGRQAPPPPPPPPPQPPHIEYLEPCAGLFGYFPCLLKTSYNGQQDGGEEYQWKMTEEYFFGYPAQYGYGETSRDDEGEPVSSNGYQLNTSWLEPQPTYYEYNDNNQQLWSHQLSYCEETYQE